MELRVINKTDEELRIKIGGEGHTSMNALEGEFLRTNTVTAAAYDVNPEWSGGQTGPVLSIKTESDVDPLDTLAGATRGVQRTAGDFTDVYCTGIDA